MKSQTLNQFQSVMQELDSFARKAGSKDKQKRKSRGAGLAAAGVGTTAVGGYGINAGIRANKQMGADRAVLKETLGKAADASDTYKNSTRTAGKKAFQKKTAKNLQKQAVAAADDFAKKGGIGKRAVGIAKADAGKVKTAATAIGKKVLGKILRRGK
jgi:hypothetical protein